MNGSPRISTPIAIVATGPTMPACDVTAAPTRSIASITIGTGAMVHGVAFSAGSRGTGGATCSAACHGRRTRYCAMHSTQATDVARPVRRSAPMRCTTSPL